MLMKTGGGGARDMIFRAIVQSDPSNKKTFADLGKSAVEAQKQITNATVEGAKKRADEIAKAAKKGSTAELAETTKAGAAMKQVRTDVQKHYDKLKQNSIRMEVQLNKQADNEWRKEQDKKTRMMETAHTRLLKQIDDEEKHQIQSLRRVATEAQRAAGARTAARMGMIEGSTSIGRGAMELARAGAYSGLVGTENTQHVLDTLIKVETAFSAYRGGTDILKGAMKLGGLFGAAGAVGKGGAAIGAGGGLLAAGGTVLAGAGALAGSVLGGKGIYDFQRDIRANGFGGGSAYGSWSDRIASGWASGGNMISRAALSPFGDSTVDWLAQKGDTGAQHVGSLRAMSRMQKDHAANMAAGAVGGMGLNNFLGARQGMLDLRFARSDMTALAGGNTLDARAKALSEQADLSRGNLGQLREWQGAAGSSWRASKEERGVLGGAVVGAENQHREILKSQLEIIREQHREKIAAAREGVAGAKEELAIQKTAMQQAKQIADDAKRALMGDAERFLTSSRGEQMQITEIARKRKAGEDLTPEQLSQAAGYREFDKFRGSQVEKMAAKYGLSDILSEGTAEKRKADEGASDAVSAYNKAELNVKQKVEVEVKLSGDQPADAEKILAELKPLLEKEFGDSQGRVNNAINEVRTFVRDTINKRVAN